MIVWGEVKRFHELQQKLDAVRLAQSRAQEAASVPENPASFRMTGLFGLIPRTTTEPIRIPTHN